MTWLDVLTSNPRYLSLFLKQLYCSYSRIDGRFIFPIDEFPVFKDLGLKYFYNDYENPDSYFDCIVRFLTDSKIFDSTTKGD